jgi:DivIVA domain-containing protein
MADFPMAKKRSRGYDIDAVNEFLERARQTYDGTTVAVTADDVRDAAFPLKRSGYETRFVDAALDRLEDVFFERERRQFLRERGGDQWRAELRSLGNDVQGRASRPKGHRFRRRGILSSGYRRSQVDAFVERISDALSGVTSMSPAVVREAVFHSEWRGYDEAQVDAFLDAVVDLLLSER